MTSLFTVTVVVLITVTIVVLIAVTVVVKLQPYFSASVVYLMSLNFITVTDMLRPLHRQEVTQQLLHQT